MRMETGVGAKCLQAKCARTLDKATRALPMGSDRDG